jgi:hypothetical protein
MAWTSPSGHVFVTGEVVTAATLNTYVKDNLLDLDRRATATGASVATSQTTASAAYVDLATVGPAVTVTTGTRAVALFAAYTGNNTAGSASFTSVAVSGATTIAAADTTDVFFIPVATAVPTQRVAGFAYFSTLTAGSNTFTQKYKVNTGTGSWSDRTIVVIPLSS